MKPLCLKYIFPIYILLLSKVCQASFTPKVSISLEAFPKPQQQQSITTPSSLSVSASYDDVIYTKSVAFLNGCLSFGFPSLLSLYGLSLLLFGRLAPGQVLLITVMRSTGYDKLERAFQELRINFRQAMVSMFANSPSLVMLARTIQQLNERKQMAWKIIQETNAAKRDENITPEEARKIAKLQKIQLRNINKDIRRLKRGTSSIIRIWRALDLYSIRLIIRDVLVEILLVVSSIHGNFFLGHMLKLYCVFKNIGSLLLEIHRNLGFPVENFVIHFIKHFLYNNDDKNIVVDLDEKQSQNVIKVVGLFWVYGLCATVTYFKEDLALEINQSMIGTVITLRGLSSLMHRIRRKSYEMNNHYYERNEKASDFFFFKNKFRGLFTIALTVFGIYMTQFTVQYHLDSNHVVAPKYLTPLIFIEESLENVIIWVNEILFKPIGRK